MARAHLRQRPHIYGVASCIRDMRELVEVLTATAEGNVTLGPGARVHAPRGGEDAVLLLPGEARDDAGLAAFAMALTAGAQRAEREARKEERTA
jgi:hypothetical protein